MLFSKRQILKIFSALPFLVLSKRSFADDNKTIQINSKSEDQMTFTLPDLPYPSNALEPYITANTLSFHHGKHHNAYVTNLNKLLEGNPLAKATLEEVIKSSAGDATKAGIFNNSAQVWNHTFYWNSMKPNGGGTPKGDLLKK